CDGEALVPAAAREWVRPPDPSSRIWSGCLQVGPGVSLVQAGGHFEGSAVLHWSDGAGGRGALLTGDTISVVADDQWVTFMRSYPNYIPLPAPAIHGILDALEPLAFDRIHAGWPGDEISDGAKRSMERSAERYLRWIGAGW